MWRPGDSRTVTSKQEHPQTESKENVERTLRESVYPQDISVNLLSRAVEICQKSYVNKRTIPRSPLCAVCDPTGSEISCF